MDACIDVDVHNKSCEYSGTETSVKPSTRQGNLNGEETYQTCVESPARWGYAITMESEKAKHEQMISKYEQMKTRYEQMKIKYEQMNAIYAENCELLHEEIHAKHEQTCEWNTSLMNGQFNGAFVAKNKAEFTEQKPLHKSPTDNPPSACALQTDEMDECRNSRVRCRLHSRRKRAREPSRIPYRKFIKLFRKARIIRLAAKSYLKKYIPSSSKLRLMLYECNRCYFTERLVRPKCLLSSNKCFVRPSLYLTVARLRTLKHKNSPLFYVCVDDKMLKKLKCCKGQTYHFSRRVISLSGDVEENPGPDHCDVNTNSEARGSLVANSVSLLETRLSELNRTALDVGGGGDCFFRAVSHQLYDNPNHHFHVRSLGVQYLQHNPEQFIESNTDYSWQGYLSNMSCQGTWADAIIIQAVANCLNLSIHITESNETFAPVTVVQPGSVTRGRTNIYIGHIGETHYVSTVVKKSSELTNKIKCGQTSLGDNLIDRKEKRRAYIREYMKKRRADPEFRKRENENSLQRIHKNIEATREKNSKAARKRKMTNPEHLREIFKQSKRKQKEENPELIREVDKQS
ncbi:hypothetical protein ACROYT_G032754 [Oculina patagonica]